MWHFKDKENGIEITGTRQQLKEQLNIFIVGFGDGDDYYEEIADVWDDRHWAIIVREYKLVGNDD